MNKDLALERVEINKNPGKSYINRKWQGIPGIERTKAGRLFVTFYSGGDTEGPDNFVLLIKSDDDGVTWSKPIFTIDPPGKVRAFDPCLWHDPKGRLWWFWNQSYTKFDGRGGVWASVCENPDDEIIKWSLPKRVANGIMMNKPTVVNTGEWLMPCAVWKYLDSNLNNIPEERFSNVYVTKDKGKTFKLLGGADVPNRAFDEHMTVQLDKCLWMLVRTKYGIGQSKSYDGGKTWTAGEKTNLGGPNSRFFIRKLKSGNILLVNHYNFTGRSNLTAMISEDEGNTWKGFLLLDDRKQVSYPDGVQAEDGSIYIVYDRERHNAKEILMAVITEKDILAGRCITPKARLKVLINKL